MIGAIICLIFGVLVLIGAVSYQPQTGDAARDNDDWWDHIA